MRRFVSAVVIAASLAVAPSAFAQAVDHSAHHPPAAGNAAPAPATPSAPKAAEPQMKCGGMMGGKMGAGAPGGQAKPSTGDSAGKGAGQQKKHCAEMMAKMHEGHEKPPK
ncbi:MAG: hypothetical protein ABIO39_14910 [Caulobacteraceae bacterium]